MPTSRIAPIAALVAGGIAAVAVGWPMWTPSPVQAVLNGAVGVTFLLTGVLLRSGDDQRGNGLRLGLAGFAWLGVWLEAYGTRPLVLVGWLFGALFVSVGAAVLLRYPEDRLVHRLHRGFVVAAFGWTVAGSFARGLFTPGPGVLAMFNIGAAVLAVLFSGLLVARLVRARGLRRQDLMPVAVAAAGAGLALGFRLVGSLLSTTSLASPLRAAEATALLAVPGGFLVAAVRRRLARAAAAEVILALERSPSVESLRDALRRALRDPLLDVYVSGLSGLAEPPASGRLAVPLLSSDGDRLGLILTDPALARNAATVRAVVGAAALVLENSRLQAGLRDRLAEVVDSRARIVEAGLTERRRLERDLHDGAQQLLFGLSMRLGTLRAYGAGQPWQAMVDHAVTDLRAAQQELRELAQGLHPALLGTAGLGPALESVASRLPLPVRLAVPARRWDPPVEAAAYFIAAEALTNAVKHARATDLTVTVADDADALRLTVTDDGIGGAEPRSVRDRVAALGGTCVVTSPPGGGTAVSVELPGSSLFVDPPGASLVVDPPGAAL
ncbi:histidine kinase [Actinoplanes sp. NPDC051470]|uniref:histidine kinase n=1 Tax=Actinoplanes sp. NPDC051470 TaxID=3157224 RepID=UPI00343E9995